MTQSTSPEAPPRPRATRPPAARPSPPTLPDGFTDLDRRAIDTARVLAMDAVQKVGNGHLGTAMSMAPTAYLLFQKWLRHDPSDLNWVARDRFKLSMGHSSLTLYVQLYLSATAWSRRSARAAHVGIPDARAPGGQPHPRRRDHHRPARPGVSATPSAWRWPPAASAVCSTRTRPRARACSTTPSGASPPTATSRRASAARRRPWPARSSWATWSSSTTTTRSPSRTTRTSPSPRTSASATRPTAGTCSAWTTVRTSPPSTPPAAAKAETGRPSFIQLKTIIAWPAPNKQNTGAAHGSALGDDEVKATKKILGLDPTRPSTWRPR